MACVRYLSFPGSPEHQFLVPSTNYNVPQLRFHCFKVQKVSTKPKWPQLYNLKLPLEPKSVPSNELIAHPDFQTYRTLYIGNRRPLSSLLF